MNKTSKILLGVAVGAGVAYLLHQRNKKKASGSVASNNSADVQSAVSDVLDSKLETRDEQVAYILQYGDANFNEETSGFEGVEFVWNEKLGKFYPKGTLTVTQEPAFASNVFYSADGTATDDPTDKAEEILSTMSDKEIQLAYNLVKYRRKNPRGISEEQAFIEMGGKDPKVVEVIKTKVSPKLNDIKALHKHPSWKEKWALKIQKFESLFIKAKKCGKRPLDKRKLDAWKNCLATVDKNPTSDNNKEMMQFVIAKCGRKPMGKRQGEEYKQCVLDAKRKYNQNLIQNSDVKTKEIFNDDRQGEFTRQVTNRQDGALFGGKRWDGRSNKEEEKIVRKGL